MVKLWHPPNILPISITCEVLKLDTSNVVKLLQLLNILPILVTCEVSQLDRSNVVKFVQPLNIAAVDVIDFPCPVNLKLNLFTEVNPVHPENIAQVEGSSLCSVTLDIGSVDPYKEKKPLIFTSVLSSVIIYSFAVVGCPT